jgi:adenylylsulfate kinase-like enzyme
MQAQGTTIWFTSLSGAGKTTICQAMEQNLDNFIEVYVNVPIEVCEQCIFMRRSCKSGECRQRFTPRDIFS